MQYRWNSRGLTLVETIVVVAIVGIATTAIASAIQTFYRGNAYLLEQTAALDSGRRGIAEAARFVREATYGDDGAYPMVAAGTSTLMLYADTDTDRSVERVQYRMIGTTLFRTISNASGIPATYPASGTATTTIATNVLNGTTTPLFRYFDATGEELSATSTPIAEIRSVRITLMVDLNPSRAPNIFTLSQIATLRNLR